MAAQGRGVTPAGLVRPAIRALRPYHVPDAGGLIKLDAMENPYGWPEPLVTAWLERLRGAPLNRYPDAAASALKADLRAALGVPEAAAVVLGNGSDELIQLIAMAVAAPGRVLMAPEPSFVMYRMVATFVGMEHVGVPLAQDGFALDAGEFRAAMARHRPAVVFLAHPNNPTGNLFDPAAMTEVIDAAPGLVVVDEAYFAFASHSFMEALGRFPNLLVMRTVSKLGLAGLRLGLVAGDPAWVGELEKLRLPYNVNVLTQLSARFALEHWDVLQDQARRIREERERLFEGLERLPGITPFPSQANFILFRAPAGRGRALWEALRTGGVLIKDLGAAGGVLRDCLRVTVGTPEENRVFLSVLAAALG